ncbi:MAG: molybdopterin-dependent oxidoreductase [Pirellulaceae bacterium]
MAIVIVDEQEIEIGDDERLNGVQVAARAGIDIPRYCWHPGLTVVASCRMCLVETGSRDQGTGKITMVPKLVPACQTPATDGTVFITNSEKVARARAMVEEDLLIRHPIDCPICDKAGECRLQDYHFEYGQEARRADVKPFTSRRRDLGSTITLFVDRCVLCSRCVRFCREISGSSELMVVNRGAHEEIDVFPEFPLANKMAGNVVDLCPVGALGDRDFLYKQRVWFLKSHPHVCAGCSTGCSVLVEENQDRIYRLKPRENPHINQWWMCDQGRYGWIHVHDTRRVTGPRRRERDTTENMEWPDVIAKLSDDLESAQRMAAVLSPHSTVEEAYLLAKVARQVDPDALLALGPIPQPGEDESFPGGFTIRAEKCPNRRGVEAILGHLSRKFIGWDELLARLAQNEFDAVWVSGGYKKDWNDAETAATFASIPLLIVQDLFTTPLFEQAHYQLPAAAFAEREGSFVNRDDRLQTFRWAVRPPAGVLSEGQLLWRLLGKPGLFQARSLLDDIAREMAFFSAAKGPVSETGVDLRVNQMATTT